LADTFFAEAKEKAKAAISIADLAEYMSDRPRRLINDIERIDCVKATIDAGRNGIPDGAIEVEREQFERKKSVPQV